MRPAEDDRALARMIGLAFLLGVGLWTALVVILLWWLG